MTEKQRQSYLRAALILEEFVDSKTQGWRSRHHQTGMYAIDDELLGVRHEDPFLARIVRDCIDALTTGEDGKFTSEGLARVMALASELRQAALGE